LETKDPNDEFTKNSFAWILHISQVQGKNDEMAALREEYHGMEDE
jgi:hypothetical protein